MARQIVVVLGLLVSLLPYLGFPDMLDTTMLTVSGLLIAFLAWSGKRAGKDKTIEEMEDELVEIESDPSSASEAKTEEIVDAPTSPEPVASVATPPDVGTSAAEAQKDKTLSVAFDKRKTRSLKKRISQDGEPQIP